MAQLSFAGDHTIQICQVQAQNESNNAYIAPCGGWTTKSGCDGGSWLTWDMSQFQGQAMYSSALAAMMAEKTVVVRTTDTCNHYDKIKMIRIIK